ncbi:MAG TPA: LD-carboxypeptidase [Clostridia bacterium]|nr:LD-carboxypeptidase [Clostridia bacterium]
MLAEKLRKGDTIGIISPSHVAGVERYESIIFGLESLGFRVKLGANLYKDTYGYAASEQERADDLNQMVLDGEVRMILFGGGEGSNELLPLIDYESIRNHPKIFCSYSDGTTILQAIHAKTGLVTYYGQAPGTFADLRHYDYLQFESHFCRAKVDRFASNGKWTLCHGGACEGILTGGYTRNFALLLDGNYFHYDADRKYLLFLEDYEKFSDVGAVSAYLSHVEQSPFIRTVSGLLFGHYAAAKSPELLGRLERFGAKHGVPVVYCDDFGHGVNHAILPIGVAARLDADAATMDFC